MDGVDLLRNCRSVLLIDWPSLEVPHELARAGLEVVAEERPPLFNAYQAAGEEVRSRRVPGPPTSVDLVYAHRPVDELPEIIERAVALGARALWLETGSPAARQLVASAGLLYVDQPSIADAARAARTTEPG
jgi:predicted CoA-binding protein